MSDDQSAEIAKLRANVAALNKSVQGHYGAIAALEATLYALMECHSNPTLLQKHLGDGLERVHADFLGGSKSEVGLEAFQAAQARLVDSCQLAISRQALGK